MEECSVYIKRNRSLRESNITMNTCLAIQEWNKLNVDVKRSSSTEHVKGSLYKSILKKYQVITQCFPNI